MLDFNRCFCVNDRGERFEIRSFPKSFYNCELPLEGCDELRRYELGDLIRLVFRPENFEQSRFEFETIAKVVAKHPRSIHCSYTDHITMLVNEQPLPADSVPLSRSSYPVLAFAEHPWYISRPLGFYVRAVGKRVLSLGFDNRHRLLLIPGVPLKLKVQVPNRGTFVLDGSLSRLYSSNDECLADFTIDTPHHAFMEAIVLDMLLNNERQNLGQIRDADLPMPTFRGQLALQGVSTNEEFAKVLTLRMQAHAAKAKSRVRANAKPEDFRDKFDTHSAVVGIRLGDSIVATSRSVFNYGDLKQSEIAQLGFEVPEFIRKGGFVEISRVATDPNFRGKDLFRMLLYQGFRITLLTGHRYILSDCEDHLLPVYKKFGAVELGHRITHPIENISLNVVYFDVRRTLTIAKYLRFIPFLGRPMRAFFKEIYGLSNAPVK